MNNNDKYNRLIMLEKNFDKLISKYSNIHKSLMEEYSLNEKRLNDNYLDFNLNFKNNVILYNTNRGILKHYPTSKSFNDAHESCKNKTTLYFDYDFNDYDKIGETIKTKDSIFNIGPPMKNEPCGYEGKNVYVSERNENKSNNIHIGKMGYINDDSSLSEYKKKNIKYSDNHIKKANKNDLMNNLFEHPYILNNLDYLNNFDNVINKCKELCNEQEECGGFSVNKESNECILKNTNTYPYSDLQEDTNIDFYMRNKEAINHSSCNKDVINIDNKLWNEFNKSNKMTKSTPCNYQKYIVKRKKEMNKLLKQLNNITIEITKETNDLSNEDIDNLEKLGYNKTVIKDKMINFNNMKSYDDVDLTGKINTSNKKTVQSQYFVYGLSVMLLVSIIVLYKVK